MDQNQENEIRQSESTVLSEKVTSCLCGPKKTEETARVTLFIHLLQVYDLRAPVRKNQTYRGKGGKFDFFHILMSDRLGYN